MIAEITIERVIFFLLCLGLVCFVGWLMYRDRVDTAKREAYMKRKSAEARAEQERKDREAIEQGYRAAALIEVLRQSKIMGDVATINKLESGNYEGPLPGLRDDGVYLSLYDDLRILRVAGVNYRGDLSAYVGHFRGTLKPEPTNDYDPFAIMVLVEDGKHIGYVREEQTDMVRSLVGAPQPLGENQPTIFPPYRIEGYITDESEGGQKQFSAVMYIRRKK